MQPATIEDGGEGDVDSNGVMDVPHAERMQSQGAAPHREDAVARRCPMQRRRRYTRH